MAKSGTRATIIDIAERAGVSFKTVSRVLNEHPRVGADLRERVVHAMAELDYRPNAAARSLAGPRQYAIALITPTSLLPLGDEEIYLPPFWADLQSGAFVACQRAGYRFVVETIDLESPTLVADLQRLRGGIDGILLAPPTADSVPLLDALDACHVPYVRIAPGVEPERSLAVRMDEYGGAAAMTRLLLSHGHRRTAFIAGPEAHVAARARLTGYLDALAECEDGSEPAIAPGDFTFSSGMQAAEQLLSEPEPPTAIFAANDDMAVGALAAASQRGIRVPDQLSIAGFDDSTTARLAWPPLTTVRQPIAAMTRTAIEQLIAMAGSPKLPSTGQIELPYVIVERRSVGACPVPAIAS